MTPAEPWSLSTGSSTILLTRLVTSRPRCDRRLRSSLGSSPWWTRSIVDELVGVVAGDRVRLPDLRVSRP